MYSIRVYALLQNTPGFAGLHERLEKVTIRCRTEFATLYCTASSARLKSYLKSYIQVEREGLMEGERERETGSERKSA